MLLTCHSLQIFGLTNLLALLIVLLLALLALVLALLLYKTVPSPFISSSLLLLLNMCLLLHAPRTLPNHDVSSSNSHLNKSYVNVAPGSVFGLLPKYEEEKFSGNIPVNWINREMGGDKMKLYNCLCISINSETVIVIDLFVNQSLSDCLTIIASPQARFVIFKTNIYLKTSFV